MLRKILMLGLTLIMCMGILSGCKNIGYHAEIVYNAQSLMNDKYLNANMTLGAYYPESQIDDTSSPATRTHVIGDKNSFDLAFNEFPQEIDFVTKVIIVHFFTSFYPTKPYELTKVRLDRGVLLVEFKLDKAGSLSVPDASSPQQTCIVVIIDKLDINSTTFKQK